MNPTAISVKDLAAVLSKAAGQKVTQQQIKKHIAAGAPCNEDGTLHLVHYTAWLASKVT